MPVDPKRVRDLFLAAAELPVPDRPAYLDRECGRDAELRAAVERLLAAHAAPASVLEPPAAPLPSTGLHTPTPDTGTVLAGRYKLLEPIGEGGMGAVWMAQQTEPVKRMVAVKLIKPGMDSRAVLARFEAERQALALMDHPNIAKVLDGGLIPDGRPFFVMELVKGTPITEFCDARKLTPRQRLELFVPVCQAVQHAHQKGIIHRDLKPSNVLVALYDDRAVPKVIDFGVAKATGQPLTEQTFHTGFGTVVGTPQYMSPEQATFNNLDVDTRSDLYSLGVLLYELLVGSPPFTRKDLERAGVLEMLRVVREVEPPRPSTKLSTADALPTVAANRSTEPRRLTGMMRNELDWIVMKALEKDRTRRYETANGFAADILRYLSGEPVQAVPPSVGYRFKKFVRKHKGPVAAGTLVALALVLGIVGTTIGFFRADAARQVAEDKENKAERATLREAEERRKAEESARAAARAAEAAREAERQAAADRAKALEETARTEEAYTFTREALDDITSGFVGEALASQPVPTPAQVAVLTRVLTSYKKFASVKADDKLGRERTAHAALRVGDIEALLGHSEESAAAFRAARDGYAALAAEFPGEVDLRRGAAHSQDRLRRQLSDQLSAGTEQETKRALALWAALVVEFPDDPGFRERWVLSQHDLAMLLSRLGKGAEAEALSRAALETLEPMVKRFPKDPSVRHGLALSQFALGHRSAGVGKSAAAETHYTRAIAILAQLAAERPSDASYRHQLAHCHDQLSRVMGIRGKPVESEGHSRTAIDLAGQLVADFPAVPIYRQVLGVSHYNLGLELLKCGKGTEGEDHLRAAVTIQEKLVSQRPRGPIERQDLCASYNSLATALSGRKAWTQAEDQLQKARTIAERLAGEYALPEFRKLLAVTHASLGRLLGETGKPVEAVEQFETARVILEQLVAAGTAPPVYVMELAKTREHLAAVLMAQNRNPEAAEHRQKALALAEKLVAEYPQVPEFRDHLATMALNAGVQLALQGKRAEAVGRLESSLALWEKLVDEFPRLTHPRFGLAQNVYNLADVQRGLGQVPRAEASYRRAAALMEQLVAESPTAEYRDELARYYFDQGHLFSETNRLAPTAEHWKKALALWERLAAEFPGVPDYRSRAARVQYGLVGVVTSLGRPLEAADYRRKALAIREKLAADFPTVPEYRADLALSYTALGGDLFPKALKLWQQLVAEKPDEGEYQMNLAVCVCLIGADLRTKGRPTDGLAMLDQGIGILERLWAKTPDHPRLALALRESLNDRAVLYQQLGRYAESLKDCDRLIEVSRGLEHPYHRALRCICLAKVGKTTEAVAAVAEFAKSNGWTAQEWYDFARVYAIASGAATDAQKELADRAMELLQKARNLGYTNTADIVTNPDFDPLRDRPDFRTLSAYLQGREYNRLAIQFSADRKRTESVDHYRKALPLLEKVNAESPSAVAYREELGISRAGLGYELWLQGVRSEAEVELRRAQEIFEKLVEENPAAAVYRVRLAGNSCNLGNLVRSGPAPPDSLSWYEKAIAAIEPVVKNPAASEMARLYARNSFWGRAEAYTLLGKRAEAAKDWDRVVEFCPPQQQPFFRAGRATARLAAGRVADAVAEVAELTKLQGWGAVQLYNFACVYAAASTKLPDPMRALANRAVELLASAVTAGYTDVARLKADADLDALRTRADFQALVAELEQKFPPKREVAPAPHEVK
jgi:tetratricopeptide (TPR) repeat protein